MEYIKSRLSFLMQELIAILFMKIYCMSKFRCKTDKCSLSQPLSDNNNHSKISLVYIDFSVHYIKQSDIINALSKKSILLKTLLNMLRTTL